MTYENIMEVNSKLKTMDIKGKKYIPVNERLKGFRMLYPEGCIITTLEKYEDGVIIYKAAVYKSGERTIDTLLATGWAMETIGSSNINRFSALENCESSAIGRALGICGIGIDTSVASYEEVANANLNEEGNKLATPIEKAGLMATIRAKCTEDGMSTEEINRKVESKTNEILELVGFDRKKQPEGMTAKQYGKAMSILNGGI